MSTHCHNITANRTGPSNAGQIEDNFVREIQRRFRRFRGLIRRTVGYENNALALKTDDEEPLIGNADPRERFEFTTRPELITKFMRWVRGAINDEILEPVGPREDISQVWIAQYLRNAYVAGSNQAIGLLFQQGVSAENPPDSEIVQRPISQRSLQTLYTRAYSNLQEITDDMADVIREELTTGFAKGYNPRKMADNITSEIRDIQKTRAETLARTEVMNAHSESMLDTYERQGVTVVAHDWSSAGDDRVCPFCSRLDGVRMSTEEIRTGSVSWAIEPNWKPQNWRLQPPAHPQCRCLLRPVPGASEPVSPLSERIHSEFEDRADVLL